MDCCQCEGIESRFDRQYVRRKLEKYRADGPKNTTRALISAIRDHAVSGMTLLDIGGGVGDIQHSLLESHVEAAINVEASSAYLAACAEEAVRQGHADRIHHIQANFVDIAADVPEADIVTLDRVICCYHDVDAMVRRSSEKAGQLYGAVYPRDVWWVRLASQLYYNLRFWLKRNPMRIFVHSTDRIEALLEENGLHRIFHRSLGTWEVVLFSRG